MSQIDIYRRWLNILASLDEPCITEPQDFKELCQALGATATDQPAANPKESTLELAFRDFLGAHPDHKAALRRELLHEALQHVDATMEHYTRIKAQRPLTKEEKEVGPVFLELLSAARRLLRTT